MSRVTLVAVSLAALVAIGLTGSALAAPPDLTVEATSPDGAIVDFSPPLVDCSPASGSLFPLGPTSVTCTDSGTQQQVGFQVTVQDTTPPAFSSVTSPLNFEATRPSGAVVSYTAPTANDLVDGSQPVTCAPVSGSTFAIRTTTVTCTASDSHGNSGSATFTVTVRDTTAPVFAAKSAGIVKKVRGKTRAKVVYTRPIATDSLDGKIRSVCTPRSGSTFKLGATLVTCTATDAHKNTSNTSFRVRVLRISASSKRALIAPADGASLFSPPLLRWTAITKATYYNVQLYRNGSKILSAWPRSNRLGLKQNWKFKGARYRLAPGAYKWYVWPGFGSLAATRYGSLIGQRTFTIVG